MSIATWASFKELIANKKILIQYSETDATYDVFGSEGNVFLWTYTITKGTADATDFETNIKPTANQPLEVKSAANRPQRVVNSPQPDGTNQTWKGFQLSFGIADTSQTTYISFPNTVYLRGGQINPDGVLWGDTVDVYIQIDVGGWTWVDALQHVEAVPLSVIHPIEFMSSESKEFTTNLRLKITVNSVAGAARTYGGNMNFYK